MVCVYCVHYYGTEFQYFTSAIEAELPVSIVMLKSCFYIIMILLISVQLPLIEIHLYGGKWAIVYLYLHINLIYCVLVIMPQNIWINHIVICLNQKYSIIKYLFSIIASIFFCFLFFFFFFCSWLFYIANIFVQLCWVW